MKLADYLSQNRVSTSDFAERVGVTPEAIRLYLRGERRPRAEKMRAISDATGGAVTPNDFFSAEGAKC